MYIETFASQLLRFLWVYLGHHVDTLGYLSNNPRD